MSGTNGIQIHEPAPLTPFQPTGLEQAIRLADTLAKSNLLPGPLRGKPADVLVTLITGHELGLSPMQAVRGLHVIDGKAVMSADLTVALVLKRRDVCEFFRLAESTDKRAAYTTKRVGSEPVTLAWTIEQAQAAGLAGRDNWKKHTAAMLRARAASALARAVYPDLVLGVYDPDEAEEFRPAARVTAPPPPPEPAPIEGEIIPPPEEPAPQSDPEPAGVSDDVFAALRAALAAKDMKGAIKAIKALPEDRQQEGKRIYSEAPRHA
jgi:hypothetical protein